MRVIRPRHCGAGKTPLARAPQSLYRLTEAGRHALNAYVTHLENLLRPRRQK